jgi:7-cyano-7-deazaguanine synthase
MCSINGIFVPGTGSDRLPEEVSAEIRSALLTTTANSSVRGKDGFGLTVFYRENAKPQEWRFNQNAEDVIMWNERFKEELTKALRLNNIRCIIAQCRAEPTTEVKPNKTYDCIPPLWTAGKSLVSHNGTIANDKELIKENLRGPGWIDSKAIGCVLTSLHEKASRWKVVERLLPELGSLVGSMSIAIFNDVSKMLLLYRNYREMHIRKYRGVYIWSSKKEYFPQTFVENSTEVEIKPYSGILLDYCGIPERFEYPEREGQDKAYVVCSSGLDSTTVAKIACMDPTLNEVNLVHCKYLCKAERREKLQFVKIAQRLQKEHPEKKVTYGFVDMRFLHGIGGSSLTDSNVEINTQGDGEAGTEYAHEWVPFRNGAMIAVVAAMCDANKIGNIYLGLNLEEAGAFCDNSTEFYEKFNEVLAVGSQARPVVRNPLASLVKHEIVALGLRIKAPIDLSWSCYYGGEKHCGRCGPCYMRKKAFSMNGSKDMMEYEYDELTDNE